jgi:hypothetical protein
MLKDRITELKAIWDQARADTERAEGAINRQGPPITTQLIKTFAKTARKRMRTEGGGYRRDYLRALAQRVEVDAQELRIMGSSSSSIRRGPRGDLLSTVFRGVGGSANSRQSAASYRRAAGLSRSPVRAQTRCRDQFR